ncbi:MAG: nucleotidyltransferase family protein, partial [Candidatus Eremiobacteraeota bacterium]|nr:nucleotidyltransferase family protein [Candidatus Eremiobacteraeota bacterium]
MTIKAAAGDQASGFSALLAASTAIEHGEPEALTVALQSVSQQAILGAAARHRCRGYLRHGILNLGLRDGRAAAITEALRAHAGRAAMQAYAVRHQLDRVVGKLNEAGVQFALLKGSARLFRGDRQADLDTMYDLDVLVPKTQLTTAIAALCEGGYRSLLSDRGSVQYWARHHHAAPLHPEQLGLPVELHFQLAPPGSLSIATDWSACQPFFELVVNREHKAICFNPLGSAVHLTVHGAGLRRLHDVVMLARILRDNSEVCSRLCALIESEQLQPVALQAIMALASRIARVDVETSAATRRYLDWVRRREGLSPYVRDRTQFVDAWYTNGGSLWGPATRLALPRRDVEEGDLAFSVWFTYRLISRLVAGA